MGLKELVIKKDKEDPIPVEVMERAIVDLAAGFKRMKSSRLSEKAIILLVQHSAGTTVVTQAQVKAVLDSAANLDRTFLK